MRRRRAGTLARVPDPATTPPQPPEDVPRVPRWRRALRGVYVAGVLVAFGVAVVARREELAAELQSVAVWPLVLSSVAGLAGVGVSALVWRRMLTGLGSVLPLRPAMRVFFVAQLGKYLPGSVWPVLAQAELGRDHGVPRRSAVAGQTLFMWIHLVTGAILGVPAVAAIGLVPAWTALAPLVLVPLLFPGPPSAVMDGLLRRLGREPLTARPRGRDMAVACAWAAVMLVCYGLHVHLAVVALATPDGVLGPVAVAVGVFAAAWSAGFLFLIAPAGAGAREVVLVAGLSLVVTSEVAFTVTLLSRLVLTLADGLWGGFGFVAGVGRRGATPDPTR